MLCAINSYWIPFAGTICGLTGVLVMALPIPIIVNNFAAFYNETNQREKFIKRRKLKQEKKEEDMMELMEMKRETSASTIPTTVIG